VGEEADVEEVVAGIVDVGRRWSSVRGREAVAGVIDRRGGGDLVLRAQREESEPGEGGEMRLGACDPCGLGPGARSRGVIFGRPQPCRVVKPDFCFSLGQG
jgi:hypothetical protein